VKNFLKAGLLGAASLTTFAHAAHAQTVAQGFALQRFDSAEAGSDWFAADSLDLRGNGRLAASSVFDYAHAPLVLRDAGGNDLTSPVRNQLYGHLGLAVNVFDRLRLALSVPVALVDNGSPGIWNNVLYRTDEGVALGDIRVGADVRLLGTYRDPFRLAVGAQVFLPTGDRSAYTGDGKARILPRVAAAGDVGPFVFAAQAAFDARLLDETFGGQPISNGVQFGGAAGVKLADDALLVGPELYGETSIKGGKVFKGPATPLEALLGVHYAVTDEWRVGLGAGHGFTTAAGSPDFRALASLTYFMAAASPPAPPAPEAPPAQVPPPPPPPPADRDEDGVLDKDDACPDVAGLAKLEGCPDADADGITDREDACPAQAGPRSDDPAKNGCPPPPDADRDGIPDTSDACPDKAGDADPDAAKNGCPKVRLVKGELQILERIEFDNGQATLRPSSEPVLNAIRRALADHPEIKKVRLEGYTDDRGQASSNLKLSQARVDAVLQWLTDHAIDASRLVAKGFGSKNPIADNKTEAGRQQNRRVQFMILQQDEAPASP
jgi:outer membrane protein OmpA-like peptidoglycan-associated protein